MWEEGRAYLRDLREATIGFLPAPDACRNVPVALNNIGRTLHTVQDAYAHSNYADPYFPSISGLSDPDKHAFDVALQNLDLPSLLSANLLLTA